MEIQADNKGTTFVKFPFEYMQEEAGQVMTLAERIKGQGGVDAQHDATMLMGLRDGIRADLGDAQPDDWMLIAECHILLDFISSTLGEWHDKTFEEVISGV